jgi:hypothetical protein
LEKYVKFSITKLKFTDFIKKTLVLKMLFWDYFFLLQEGEILGNSFKMWLIKIGHYYITHDAFIFTSKHSSHFILFFLSFKKKSKSIICKGFRVNVILVHDPKNQPKLF